MAKPERQLRPCCLVSEVLQEAGLDRESARRLRQQVLEGVMLLCQWQLARIEESKPRPPKRPARKVAVE